MRTISLALALAVLSACGGSDKTTGPKTVPGSYSLNNVNGSGLPAVYYQEPGYKLEVTAGAINLSANGSFTDTYSFRETDGATVTSVTVPCQGTWAQSGSNIVLQEVSTADCGDQATTIWDGNNTLTVTWASVGVPAVHKR